MHKRVARRKPPGIKMIHQELVRRAFSDKESILPQEMVSIGSPIPMKLKVDSAMIALRMFITTINMMEDIKLGVKWFHNI